MDNFKVALSAEVSVGKAAGLYEPRTNDDDSEGKTVDPAQLSTGELRKRLARVSGILTAPVVEQPADPPLDDDEENNEV